MPSLLTENQDNVRRRTKVVATLGPSTDDPAVLERLIRAGADVLRVNFSHGKEADHRRRVAQVRELAAQLDCDVGILADLQGPKIRLGLLPDEGGEVPTGGEVYCIPGAEDLEAYERDGVPVLPIVYPALADDVQPGALVLIDDGSIRLVVSRIDEDGVWARVVAGGTAKSRKGVNLPGVAVSASGSAVTSKARSSSRCRISGLFTAFSTAAFSRCAISPGVPAGTNIPIQV
jgi:pyruvate kinase